MKKILICLLMAALLFSQATTAGAETSTDDGISNTTTAEEVDKTSDPVKVVPSESDLPEGYEIDSHFSMTITLNDENGWSYNLKDLIEKSDDDDYIYFVVEENVAEGYSDFYARSGTEFSRSSPGVSTGNVIVVKNVKEGNSPVYELPESGGIGTAPYTVGGVAILLIAGVYGMILHHKQKKANNNLYE